MFEYLCFFVIELNSNLFNTIFKIYLDLNRFYAPKQVFVSNR